MVLFFILKLQFKILLFLFIFFISKINFCTFIFSFILRIFSPTYFLSFCIIFNFLRPILFWFTELWTSLFFYSFIFLARLSLFSICSSYLFHSYRNQKICAKKQIFRYGLKLFYKVIQKILNREVSRIVGKLVSQKQFLSIHLVQLWIREE